MSTRADGFYWVSIEEFDELSPEKQQYNTDGSTRIYSHTGEAINIMDITVERSAKAIMSPIETGSMVFDNKVIMPLHVTVRMTVDEKWWSKVWDKLVAMYNNRTYKFYSVYTRGELIEDLMLVKLPRRETSEMFDTVEFNLEFIQVIYASEKKRKVTSPQNQKTANTGLKNSTPPKSPIKKAVENSAKNVLGLMTGFPTIDMGWISEAINWARGK